jgi:hypothetical protein
MFQSTITTVKNWLIQTKSSVTKFLAALLIAYIFLILSIVFQWPISTLLLAASTTLLIPFGMIVMLATSNPIYENLYSSHWGKAVLGIIGFLYVALSCVWAAGEVNRIFVDAPGNLPWTISALAAVYFFKNIVLVFAAAVIFITLIYSTYWIVDAFIINYKSAAVLLKRFVFGVLFVLSIGLISGTAGFVTVKSDDIAILIAVNADFSSKHQCKGEIFDNSKGVLFLTSGEVLIAKHSKVNGKTVWEFPKNKCAT